MSDPCDCRDCTLDKLIARCQSEADTNGHIVELPLTTSVGLIRIQFNPRHKNCDDPTCTLGCQERKLLKL